MPRIAHPREASGGPALRWRNRDHLEGERQDASSRGGGGHGDQEVPDRHDLGLTDACLGWRRRALLLQEPVRADGPWWKAHVPAYAGADLAAALHVWYGVTVEVR
ncbi:hypothetical protein ACIRG5_23715 [Lentzea sp. NPDC102401]|uniref:hypothetical protein n=1 Tax=Lentzea sp. NPDC102401 TaxID=3364128 RepID=UPI00380BB0A2